MRCKRKPTARKSRRSRASRATSRVVRAAWRRGGLVLTVSPPRSGARRACALPRILVHQLHGAQPAGLCQGGLGLLQVPRAVGRRRRGHVFPRRHPRPADAALPGHFAGGRARGCASCAHGRCGQLPVPAGESGRSSPRGRLARQIRSISSSRSATSPMLSKCAGVSWRIRSHGANSAAAGATYFPLVHVSPARFCSPLPRSVCGAGRVWALPPFCQPLTLAAAEHGHRRRRARGAARPLHHAEHPFVTRIPSIRGRATLCTACTGSLARPSQPRTKYRGRQMGLWSIVPPLTRLCLWQPAVEDVLGGRIFYSVNSLLGDLQASDAVMAGCGVLPRRVRRPAWELSRPPNP